MLKKIGLGLLLFLALLAIGFFIYAQGKKPQLKGSVDLVGLTDEVVVYFDDYGVPHIYAQSESDAYRSLGYVHAQDRLWQMELIRRIAPGRLSEVFGEGLVDTDKFFRALGVSKTNAKAIAALDKEGEAYLLTEAYLSGINAYIEAGELPVEFGLVGIEAEAYTLEDVFNVFAYMSFSFAQAHKTDPLLSNLLDKLGPNYVAELDLDIDPKTTLIKNYRRPNAFAENAYSSIDELMAATTVPPLIGSNSWVIGAKKTANKKVIFANDPHIGFSQPAVWYQAHLVSPGREMYGFHLALGPFPLLGHNRDYAYGMTMLENDDIDFYRLDEGEKLSPRKETILVKGGEAIEFEVLDSKLGPVMNGLLEEIQGEDKVAMSWIYTNLENKMLDVAYRMSHAQNLMQFRNAVADIHAPGLNVMYGDARDNIAWFGSAQLYERGSDSHSKFILDGMNKADTELTYLDFDQNPQAINPRWNYVYSANNQPEEVNGKLYPGYYLPEDRAKQIVNILSGKEDFTQKDVEKMAMNVHSSKALDNLRGILGDLSKVNLNANEKQAIEILQAWDGQYTKESPATTIYFNLVYQILKNTFEDEMGEENFEAFMKTHLYKRQIAKQIGRYTSLWWDDTKTPDVKENREEIFTRSFHETISKLEDQLGGSPQDWRWSEVSHVVHKHAFDQNAMMRGFFNVGPFKTNGGNEVINNQLFKLNGEGFFEIDAGPSTRRIIDFSQVDKAVAILPTGQSGNVFSPHYEDQADKYLEGEYVPMLIDENEIKQAENRLLMVPLAEN